MRRLPFVAGAVLLTGGAFWFLRSQPQLPTQIQSPQALSFVVAFGVGDKTGATWDGSITASGTTILSLEGWRLAGADSIEGTSGWKLATRAANAVGGTGPLEENGVIVTAADSGGNPTFAIQTAQGDFSFAAQDVSFGLPAKFLNGRAVVTRVPAPLALTQSAEDEDFPALAQSGDDIWVSYVRFIHGDRSLAMGTSTSTPITDFRFLARPTGGDQVFVMHYSQRQRLWTGPFAITDAGEDIFRTAVAIDGQQRVWVFYAARRNGNYDIYARACLPDGSISDEQRLTSDPGVDLGPVAATDAHGRVWLAWQGFRNGNLEILASALQDDGTFSPESVVSFSPASDWDPAIAAASNGEVAISWDTYDKGDYDVYLRRVSFDGQVEMDDAIPVAATLKFEARSSLAYDAQNRLWIAYEVSGPKWGKDFGAYDTSGIALYQNHTVEVRVLVGNALYATADDVAKTLPGVATTQLFLASPNTPIPAQPDPGLAARRTPNNGVGGFVGPRNSFPRLATDPQGTVYLAYRHMAGTGLSSGSVGSVWLSEVVWFDGARWNGPGYVAKSDGMLDNRPALTAVAPGWLMIAQATDHRLSPLVRRGAPQADGVNADIYALELGVTRRQQSPQLQLIGTVTPDQPDDSAVAEAGAIAVLGSYRASVGGDTLRLVRGDFHRHTEISSDGGNDGPLVDAYRYAIDTAGLDWMGCCDHDDGGGREYNWWLQQKYNDAYYLGGRFLPMYYYERSVQYPEGHRNVMFATRGIRPLPRLPKVAANAAFAPAPDTAMLYNYLRFFSGVTASHTSGTDMGTDWRNNDPYLEPMVEIYQGDRQNYEMPGAPRSNSAGDSIGGYEAAGYVSNAFGMGYQFSFQASSDHISTHISFANLWVTEPTRQAIIDAVHKRHTYAATDNILADFRSGSHFMGDAFTNTGAPSFAVKLWGTNPFADISVVKDGNVVYSTAGDARVSFTWQDTAAQKGKTSYYYVRGLQSDGQIVWVSPMWVTIQ